MRVEAEIASGLVVGDVGDSVPESSRSPAGDTLAKVIFYRMI
jgi:hypothetical protein